MAVGIVKDLNTDAPLGGAKINIFSPKNEQVLDTHSCKKGTFSIKEDCEKGIYTVIAFKKGYGYMCDLFNITNPHDITVLEVNLELAPKAVKAMVA